MEKFAVPSPDNSEKPPQFIREFSRENSPEERDEIAATIRAKRQERDAFRVEQNELTSEQERLLAELDELKEKIAEYNSAGFLNKITDYLEYRQIQAEVVKQLEAQGQVEQALQELGETPPMFDEPKKILEEFYQGENQKWAEAGYTKEDIQKHFSEENLSQLTVEEYALLMRRFPGEMVTHVTRQGVRDHNGMFEHSAGLGETHDGFVQILKEGKLSSSVEIALSKAKSNYEILKYLNVGKEPDEDSVPRMVQQLKNVISSFSDKSAVHFAVEGVLDGLYGGERGNEIFFAYPSATIASQMKFNHDPTVPPTPNKEIGNPRNDIYVWTEGKGGLGINAGLTFIPDDAMVDAETGSLYELDKNGKPVKENIDSDKINPLSFKKTHNPISSKEYWETYFLKNPEQRPSKIVYYKSEDGPSKALWKWREGNQITKTATENSLGFTENTQSSETRPDDSEILRKFKNTALSALVSEYSLTAIMGLYNGGYPNSREEANKLLEEMFS